MTTDTPSAPLLGDGTAYTAGMPLWDWWGRPLHPKNLTQPLELCGEGWYLGTIPLVGLYASRPAALRLAVRPDAEWKRADRAKDVKLAESALAEAEDVLRRIDAEIAEGGE